MDNLCAAVDAFDELSMFIYFPVLCDMGIGAEAFMAFVLGAG